MSTVIKSVFIVTKGDNPRAITLGEEVRSYLEAQGVETTSCGHIKGDEPCMNLDKERKYDLALILGGDGTFIAAARRLLPAGVPLLGVNLGQVGFLTELSPDDWKDALAGVLGGGYSICPRLVLSYKVMRGDKELHAGIAVNDIVISRGRLARLIRLGISYDDRSFISMRSDGVIVSTPTGSTAYGVSAGGPLLMPGVDAFSVVPICPFLNGFKPMVLPANKKLGVQIQGDCGDVFITEDGQGIVDLEVGDVINIVRGEQPLLLAETPAASYFQKLKTKGFLLER